MTKGIFVTTSKFRRGAYKSINHFSERGIGIELIDGDRFYDALRIKRICNEEYEKIIDVVSKVELEKIYHRGYDFDTYIKGEEKKDIIYRMTIKSYYI